MTFSTFAFVLYALGAVSLAMVCAGGLLLLLFVYVGWARELCLYALPQHWRKKPLEGLDGYSRAYNRLYRDKHWHQWMDESSDPVIHKPSYRGTDSVLDEILREKYVAQGHLPDDKQRGHYKFHNGDCITIDVHNPLAAIAYELEQLLGLEAAHPNERPLAAPEILAEPAHPEPAPEQEVRS